MTKRHEMKSRASGQSGSSLLESLVALNILFIVIMALLTMTVSAIATTENQGHLAARTAEYAQDKMEQLLALAYGDSTSDTSVNPTSDTGGSGLSIGGSLDAASPMAGYVDYLDLSGNLLASPGGSAPGNWFYVRVWQVSTPSGTLNLKQISVLTQTKSSVGPLGSLPQSTVVVLKTNPF